MDSQITVVKSDLGDAQVLNAQDIQADGQAIIQHYGLQVFLMMQRDVRERLWGEKKEQKIVVQYDFNCLKKKKTRRKYTKPHYQ